MKLRTLAATGLAGVVVVASSAAGGPLNRRHVPADCSMLVHVDVEALQSSHIGAFLKEHRAEINDDLDDFQRETGLDPFEDVFDITVYVLSGGNLEHGDGVVVLATLDNDLQGLIEKLEDHAEELGYRTRERDGRTVHSFKPEGDRVYAMVQEARGGRHQLMLSPDSDALELAADVIDGEGRSLRESDSVLANFRPEDGAIVYASIGNIDALPVDDEEIRSKFLSKAEGAFFQLGEDDDEVFATLQVSTHKEEDAILLSQIGQGLIAAGALVNSADDVDEEVRLSRARLLNGVRFRSDDNRIRLSLRYDVDDLRDIMEMIEDY
jgi:hypothetical protein